MIDILGALFSSAPLVKVLRLFLMNSDQAFDRDDITDRCKITREQLKTEMKIIDKLGFLKKKTFTKTIITPSKRKGIEPKTRTKRSNGWVLNPKFPFVDPLRKLLIESDLIESSKLVQKFKKAGRIKLLVLSGIFMHQEDLPIDILVVGEHLSRAKLDKIFRDIESEIGKELRYAIFETDEFKYRLDMFDKLILDVFSNDHERVVNNMEFSIPR